MINENIKLNCNLDIEKIAKKTDTLINIIKATAKLQTSATK